MDGLDAILTSATQEIRGLYINLPIDNGTPQYRERVYCYELYHQMRMRWPENTQFVLNGEVDKAGHKKFPEDLRRTPDFLVHVPGQMTGNDTIIEVKSMRFIDRGSIRECEKDLETLSRFKTEIGYKRAIYLIYGEHAGREVIRIVQEEYLMRGWSEEIELWLHPEAGRSAKKVFVLTQPANRDPSLSA